MANAWIIRPLPIVGATANRTSVGAPINVGNDYAGVIWGTEALDAYEELLLDLGSDQTVDTIVLFGVGTSSTPNFEVVAAKSADPGFTGATYYGGTAPVLSGSVMPVSGRGTGLWQRDAAGAGAYRYWRLRFIVFGQSGEALSIARVAIGKRIQLERNFSYGATFGVRDLGSLDFSARGVLLRRRAKKLRTVALTFSNVRRDEVEAQTKPLLERIGNTEMVALVTDPAADAQRQNRSYFGSLVGDLGHTQRNAVGWEAKVNMVSVF